MASNDQSINEMQVDVEQGKQLKKCEKCFKVDDQNAIIALPGCGHHYHAWCLIGYIDKDCNQCTVCKNHGQLAIPINIASKPDPPQEPQTYSATYVIVDMALYQLGERPPHSHVKYHYVRQILGLTADQSPPPPFKHVPLTFFRRDQDKIQFLKDLYANLDAPVSQQIDYDALEKVGMKDYGYTVENTEIISRLKQRNVSLRELQTVPFDYCMFLLGHCVTFLRIGNKQ